MRAKGGKRSSGQSFVAEKEKKRSAEGVFSLRKRKEPAANEQKYALGEA